jgi:hypothetical protein
MYQLIIKRPRSCRNLERRGLVICNVGLADTFFRERWLFYRRQLSQPDQASGFTLVCHFLSYAEILMINLDVYGNCVHCSVKTSENEWDGRFKIVTEWQKLLSALGIKLTLMLLNIKVPEFSSPCHPISLRTSIWKRLQLIRIFPLFPCNKSRSIRHFHCVNWRVEQH